MAKVCIIGAGLAGLVSAKILLEDGFEVTVFEKSEELGGVWASFRHYPGLQCNNAKGTYHFSDFPMPDSFKDYPTASEMNAYLNDYARHFNVFKCIRFNSEVKMVQQNSNGKWIVTIQSSENLQVSEFDFVVVCNGIYNEPNRPNWEGIDKFKGNIIHTTETNGKSFKGQRVAVVGFGASGVGCSSSIANMDVASCHLIFNEPFWMFPRYMFGVNPKWMVFTRFNFSFIEWVNPRNSFEYFLNKTEVGKRVKTFYYNGLCQMASHVLGIDRNHFMIPKKDLPYRTDRVFMAPNGFFNLIKQGKLNCKQTSIKRFLGDKKVELADGEVLELDTIILATGFKLNCNFLEKDLKSKIFAENGELRLHRVILPPSVHTIGFIGYQSTISNTMNSELGARWLSQCFQGKLKLPSEQKMNQEIEEYLDWSKRVVCESNNGTRIAFCGMHILDEMMKDMNLQVQRGSNFFSEYFLPALPERYNIAKELKGEKRMYISFSQIVMFVVFMFLFCKLFL